MLGWVRLVWVMVESGWVGLVWFGFFFSTGGFLALGRYYL